MPYISPEDRPFFDQEIDALAAQLNSWTGETLGANLNYVITRLMRATLLRDKPRYRDYAEAIATLECAKLELYTHRIRPYEDRAIKRNGDIA